MFQFQGLRAVGLKQQYSIVAIHGEGLVLEFGTDLQLPAGVTYNDVDGVTNFVFALAAVPMTHPVTDLVISYRFSLLISQLFIYLANDDTH